MEEILTEKSIWKKTAEELTVADQVKLATGVSIASMVIPFAVVGVGLGVAKITEIFLDRRAQKKADKTKKVVKVK